MTVPSAKPFVWYELMTTDPTPPGTSTPPWSAGAPATGAATAPPYTIMRAGERMVTGVMALPDEARAAGVPPCWIGSIAADDADAATDRVVAAGGRLLRAPADIPGVGRFSVVADPGGGTFQLLATPEPPGPPPAPGAPGHVGWHELCAEDGGEAMPSTPGSSDGRRTGTRHGSDGPLPAVLRRRALLGRDHDRPPQVPMRGWLFYFTVPARRRGWRGSARRADRF